MSPPQIMLGALAITLAGCAAPPAAEKSSATADRRVSIEGVAARTLELRDFRLESGVVLKELTVAYETYGKLDAAGRNAVLVAHGNTSSFHAAGRYARNQAAFGVNETDPGWWNDIIGPGKAFDTNRYFVVSSNMLGGAFGTTGPRSIDPATGKPYGPDFPQVTLGDMVAVQKALLDALGVKHLVAVAGPSFGGFLAFEWAVKYPQSMDGIVVVVSSARGGKNPRAVQNIVDSLAKDPNWNGGWYYDRGGIPTAMTDLRVATLKAYGAEQRLAQRFADPAAREAQIRKEAAPWASHFDGHSLVVQRRASEFRDHEKDFGRIRAKVLYVLSTSDKLFPPSIAPGVMAKLKAAGVDATYYELQSENGHSAGTLDARQYEPVLREFLDRLASPS